MSGHPIPPAVATELQRQMNHEYGAAHAYTALAHWCDEQNLKGFARFFHKQSGEERVHAQRFADHLLDRGTRPEQEQRGEQAAHRYSVSNVAGETGDLLWSPRRPPQRASRDARKLPEGHRATQ